MVTFSHQMNYVLENKENHLACAIKALLYRKTRINPKLYGFRYIINTPPNVTIKFTIFSGKFKLFFVDVQNENEKSKGGL